MYGLSFPDDQWPFRFVIAVSIDIRRRVRRDRHLSARDKICNGYRIRLRIVASVIRGGTSWADGD